MSIRLRLTVLLTVLLGVVLTGLAVLVYIVVSDQMANRLDTTLRERAADIAEELPSPSHDGPDDQRGRAQPCVAGGGTTQPVQVSGATLFVEIFDTCGNADYRSTNLSSPLPIPQKTLSWVSKNHSKFFDATLDTGEHVRILGLPQGDGDHPQGALFVATPLGPHFSDLFRLKVLLALIVIGTTALCAGIGWFLAAQAMKPVDQMTTAAREIGGVADLSGRVPVPDQKDEIRRLALTFNEMLGRLQLAFTTQRQFLADASHELRSPLTAIRANVEALRRGGEVDPAERDETLRVVEREVDRMGRLVDDLLSLARADEGQEPVRIRLSLDSLLLEVYHQQRPLAGRVRLTLGEFEPVEIDGDSDRLKQLLINLVDNALRHTPAGGTVTLDLLHGDKEATIRVRDTGGGIPPEHLPHIFERFYRIDSARSRQVGGTGLGLAISREIVVAHGGRIEVESTVGEGTTFIVSLPSPAAPPLPAQKPNPQPQPVPST